MRLREVLLGRRFRVGRALDTTEEKNAVERFTAVEAQLRRKLALPPGYDLEYGADVLLLRRGDGSVATFGAKSVSPAEVARTAEDDRRARGARSSA
jgi:hypothetical protein